MKYLISLIAVTVLLLACSENSAVNTDEKDFRGSISGLILDQFGEPISGVAITTADSGYNSNSLADGTYSIPDVSSGIYSLSFTKTGFFDTIADTAIDIATAEEIVSIDMVVRKITGDISVSVVDEDSFPLSGVSVLAYGTNSLKSEEFPTNDTGSGTFKYLDLDIYTLTFFKDNYTPKTVICTLSISNYKSDVTVQLAKTVAALNGTVKDEENKVLDDVTVALSSVGGVTKSDGNTAVSDITTGEFLFQEVNHGIYLATFTKDQYTQVQVPCTLSFAKDTTTLAVKMIYNPDGGDVAGVVTTVEGAPIEGITITLISGDKTYNGTTNSAGEYAIKGIKTGNYEVTFSGALIEGITLADSIAIVKDIETVIPTQLFKLKISLNFGNAEGVVKNTENLPLAGVSVTLSKSDFSFPPSISGDDGAYTISDVDTGTYAVTFSGETVEPSTLGDSVTILKDQTITIPTTKLTVKSDPVGTVTGIILNTGTPQTPIYEADISLSNSDHKLNGISGIDGSFTITDIPIGTYEVRFGGVSSDSILTDSIVVTKDNTTAIGTLILVELTMNERSVNGLFDAVYKSGVDSVIVTLKESSAAIWSVKKCVYNKDVGDFSGNIKVSQNGSAWQIVAKAYKNTSKTGQSDTIVFTTGSGNIVFNSFTDPTNALPTVTISANKTSVIIDSNIIFTAAPTDPYDNDIRSYAWEFGDGSTGFGEIASHRYQEEVNFTAKVTITDGDGNTAESTYPISVINSDADIIGISNKFVSVGDNVSFTADVVDEDLVEEIIWDWGDGSAEVKIVNQTTSTESHSYSSSGTYTVTVKSIDKWNKVTTKTAKVVVQSSKLVTVVAGNNNTMILGDNGSLWATGSNNYGQHGDGTTTDRSTPVQVISSGVTAVAGNYSCTKILKNDGSLWETSYNYVSDGGWGETMEVKEFTPVAAISSGGTALAVGVGHTMILKGNGSLWATGLNNYGQLGDGTTDSKSTPVEVIPSGITAVSAGLNHTMILKDDGSLWAMGRNDFGQLGDGTTTNSSTPVQIVW
jgi:chitodextrinase